MYNQKEMESYVKTKRSQVQKYEQGEEIDPRIKWILLKQNWTNPICQKIAWEYIINRISIDDLCEMLDVSNTFIRKRLKKMQIPLRDRSESQREPRLNKKQVKKVENLILGTMLGDAGISKPIKNSKACRYNHTNIKKDYNEWIQKQLEKANIKQKTNIRDRNENWNTIYTIQTRTYPYFYKLRQEWYPEGIKIVPKSLELNPEILLYWYLDDGSLGEWGIRLCTNSFDKKSDQHLQQELYLKFGIMSKRSYIKAQDKYLLRLNKEDRNKFLEVIISEYENIDVKEFDYKFKGFL